MNPQRVQTARGRVVRLPAYIPVTTFSSEHPTDRLVRPFLPRFADMQMVSFHYARQMPKPPAGAASLPTFIDSGGFLGLLAGAEVIEREDGLGIIRRNDPEPTKIQGNATSAAGAGEAAEVEVLTPELVLELQLQRADFAATLDMPIPLALATDPTECARRIRLTVANARWALQQLRAREPQPGLRLFGSVQGFDLQSYEACARELVAMGFVDLALGGFVPRISQPQLLQEIVRRVRAVMAGAATNGQSQPGLLHCFGIGEPRLARALFEAGATSVDSSSFARAAASGKRWDGVEWDSACPSPLERAHAALANLEYGVRESGAAALRA